MSRLTCSKASQPSGSDNSSTEPGVPARRCCDVQCRSVPLRDGPYGTSKGLVTSCTGTCCLVGPGSFDRRLTRRPQMNTTVTPESRKIGPQGSRTAVLPTTLMDKAARGLAVDLRHRPICYTSLISERPAFRLDSRPFHRPFSATRPWSRRRSGDTLETCGVGFVSDLSDW